MSPTRATHCGRTPAHGPALPARQVTWTRLGNGMGYTNSEAKRAEIRVAVLGLAWRDPAELRGVLDVAPTRQVITFILGGRRWALHRAAMTDLSPSPLARPCRLLGIESVSGERHVLLDDTGYEWIHLYTDRPAHDQAPREVAPR